MSTSLLEKVADIKSARNADALATYNAMLRRHAEHQDTDPAELLDICNAAGKTLEAMQTDLDDLEERGRLTSDVADTTKRRKTRDKSQAAMVLLDTDIATAEKALLKLKDDRTSAWARWHTANELHNAAIAAAARLKRPQFARFDSANEAAEREILDRNDTAAKERSQELSAARQRLADAEYTLAACDHQIEQQEKLLTHNQQFPLEAAPIRQATERLESLKADRKWKIAAAGKARSKLRSLES